MWKPAAGAACALLLLAGCGETGTAPAGNEARIRIANPHSDQLKRLSPLYQRIGLGRAIRDSGKRCRSVERLAYQQEYEQLAMWVASCDDGRRWGVFIAPSQDVQVRDCAEHAQLGLPICRPLPPLPPDPRDPANRAKGKAPAAPPPPRTASHRPAPTDGQARKPSSPSRLSSRSGGAGVQSAIFIFPVPALAFGEP